MNNTNIENVALKFAILLVLVYNIFCINYENKIIWNISEIIKKHNEAYTGISELLTTSTLRVLESRAS